ncbi:translesion DNA synthesis-associated protein ImuA [Stutzerimonas tarimensis]|uniref:Translesion DNA synthesis-associated protein ImuA n=1 Tax=Stutzerimonas tarimensis TaxID=1507735 RepID=A0ABV7T235_9GAMM
MTAVIALESLLRDRQVWKGQGPARPIGAQPSGHARLDAVLPTGGWPNASLSEILVPGAGMGELGLLWPTLERLSRAGERIVLVAPPYNVYPQAWLAAGIDLRQVVIIEAEGKNALWATEQCLRSGTCGAVLCWPGLSDERTIRRLCVAAETGQTLAFAYRPLSVSRNPSPAALRIAFEEGPGRVRVLKCRGGLAPAAPVLIAAEL